MRYLVIIIAAFMLQFSLQGYAMPSSSTVSGKVVDAKNNAPLTRQTIYIADLSTLSFGNSSLLTSSKIEARKPASNTRTCPAPTVPYLSYTCTNNQGEFTLSVSTTSSQPQQLVIVDHKTTIKLDLKSSNKNLGIISVSRSAQIIDKVAIISLSSNTKILNHSSTGHQLATASGELVSYVFDSEILIGYGIETSNDNIEYHQNLRHDSNGKSIFDVKRFSTILVKGSWQNILTQYDQSTINRMLQYVEQGGRLLIKDNKKQLSKKLTRQQFI